MRLQGLQRARAARTLFARKGVEWRAALGRFVSHEHNPFWAQAARVESRAATPFKALLWIWLVGAFFTLCSAEVWTSSQFNPARFERDGLGLVALLWLDVFGLGAWVYALIRNAQLLRVELLKARLLPTQLTPQTPEEHVWLLCAPVTLWSAILLAPAAPALAILMMQGVVTVVDGVGLLFLALIPIFNVPAWNPGTWQAQLERRAATNAGDGFWKPPHLTFPFARWGAVLVFGVLISVLEPRIPGRMLAAWVGGWNPAVLRPLEIPVLGWPLFAARWLVTPQPFFAWALPPLVLVLPFWMALRRRKLGRLAATLEPGRWFWTIERQNRWRRDELVMMGCTLIGAFGFLSPGATRDHWPSHWFIGAAPTHGESVAAWFIWCALSATWALTALANGAIRADPCSYSSPEFWRELRLQAQGIGATTLAVWLGVPLACGTMPFSIEWARVLIPTLATTAIWGVVVGASLLRATPVARVPKRKNAPPEPDAPVKLSWREEFRELWTMPAPNTKPRSTRVSQLAGWLLLAWIWNPPILSYFFSSGNFLAFVRESWHLFSPLTLFLALRNPGVWTQNTFWLAVAVHSVLAIPLILRARRNLRIARGLAPIKTRKPRKKASSTGAPAWMEFNWSSFGGARKPGAHVQDPMPRGARVSASSTFLSRAPLRAPSTQNKALLEWLGRFQNPLLILETRRLMGQSDWRGDWRAWTWALAVIAVVANLVVIGGNVCDYLRFGTGVWHESLGELNTWACWILLGGGTLISIAAPGILTAAYDRDRLDGTLETLFLTPLAEREIAWAKLAPVLLKWWPMQAWQLPLAIVLAILAALQGQFDALIAVFPVAVWVLSSLLRSACWFHGCSVLARKTGSGNSWALWLAPLGLFEAIVLSSAIYEGTGVFALTALLMSGAFALESWVFWRASLWVLRRQRRSERRSVTR